MKKIDRKDFLKLGGGAVVGTLAGATFSGAPFLGLQWLVQWTQDQYVPTKGKEHYLKTICEACPEKCEMSIRMISDRAVMLNSSNNGCPVSQNGLQLLYHPERIDAPLKRVGKKGKSDYSSYTKVSWESALTDIAGRMKKLIGAKKGNMIAGISGDRNAASLLLDRLVSSAGSPNTFSGSSLEALSDAALGGTPAYDFKKADYILSFGARLFEGWGSPCSMNSALTAWKESGARLVQVDALCTRTASLASDWVNIKPGTELYLALGIANYLITKKGKNAGAAGWTKIVKGFTLDKTEKLTGVDAKKIVSIAEAFSRARNPIAVGGRGSEGVSSSSAELAAVYALNTLVNSRAVTLKKIAGLGGVKLSAEARESLKGAKKPTGLDEFIKNGTFDLLFINGADPLYTSVYGRALKEKMEKALVVSFTPIINDSALYADYIFPTLSFLEEDTTAGKAPLKPYGKAKHAGDVLLALAKKLDSAAGNFPWSGYIELVKRAGAAKGAAFKPDARALSDELAAVEKILKPSAEFPLFLLPTEFPYIGENDGMAYPYRQKLLGRKAYADKKMWVYLNRETADKYGVSEGEKIDIESARGEIGSVRAHLTDTIAPDVIAVPLGFGHNACTKYAKGKGYNPKEIMSDEIDPLSGIAGWWITKVKIS